MRLLGFRLKGMIFLSVVTFEVFYEQCTLVPFALAHPPRLILYFCIYLKIGSSFFLERNE